MILYEVTWETSSILKSIVSFVNVSARPVFFQHFAPQDYRFMTTCLFFTSFFACSKILYFTHFSRTFKWPFTLQQDVIFFNVLLFSTTAYPLNVDKFAMPTREGWGERFLVSRRECTSNGNYWNDRQVLAPLSTLPYLFVSFLLLSPLERIALPRYCAHKRIITYTSAHKILCMFASIAKVLQRFDSNML